MLDEVEERRLCPVDVVQDDHEWPLAGHSLELAPDGPEDLLGRPRRIGRKAAERVGERGERHAFAVRAAGAVEDGRLGSRPQLEREPRLADPGLAKNGQEDAAPFVRRVRERLLDLGELGRTADERRVQPPRAPDRSGHELDQPESVAVERLELGGVCEQSARRRPDENLASRCCLEHPFGEHDHAAAHIAVRADEAETRLDARAQHRPDPCRCRELAAEHGELVARLGCGTYRTERVVLVRRAGTEDSHRPAIRKPTRDPAVPLDGGSDQRKAALRDVRQELRVSILGVACAVDEGHGDRLAPIGIVCPGCGCEDVCLRRELEQWIVAQDRLLQGLELWARLDTELVDERQPRPPVGLERVRLTAGAIERQHQLFAERLAVRMFLDERLECR